MNIHRFADAQHIFKFYWCWICLYIKLPGHLILNHCYNRVRTQNAGAKMENLYTFGKEKYIPADELQRTYFQTIKNIITLVVIAVKCTIFGIFVTIKSLLQSILPFRPKDIRDQVALVRFIHTKFVLISFNFCAIQFDMFR